MEAETAVVIAALVGAAGTTTAAILGPIANRNWMRKNIGDKNGKGTVQDIGHQLLDWSEAHTALDEQRHTAIVERLDALEADGTNRPT